MLIPSFHDIFMKHIPSQITHLYALWGGGLGTCLGG